MNGARILTTAAVALTAGIVGAPQAHAATVLGVGGAVATKATYSAAQLAAQPQTTVTAPGGASATGVLLESLVQASQPTVPSSAKNGLLRVTARVISAEGRSITVALGEVDPSFGNHGAVLVGGDDSDGPTLVIPGDSDGTRTITDVTNIQVGVTQIAASSPPAGGLTVGTGLGSTVTLTAAQLARLATTTLTVSFKAGPAGATQTHAETGPTLAAVLAAAKIPVGQVASVAVAGSDGYGVTVTPDEATVGGRPLLLSTVEDGTALAQPRLVPAGDVKGGRYDSSLVALAVTRS